MVQVDVGTGRGDVYSMYDRGITTRGMPNDGDPVHAFVIHSGTSLFAQQVVYEPAGAACSYGHWHAFLTLETDKVTCPECLRRLKI